MIKDIYNLPDIGLFAFFPDKAVFDFPSETYEQDTLFLLSSGSFDYAIDGGEFRTLKAGYGVYCPAGHEFRRRASDPMRLYMIEFYFDNFSLKDNIFKISDRAFFDLSMISNRAIVIKPDRGDIFAHFCSDIVLDIQNNADAITISDSLKHLLTFIDENYTRVISNEELCARLGCSQVSLISQFKAAVGLTPQKYITKKRLEHACQLLLSGDLTVAEIAYSCGYDDPLYFTRLFKKHKGFSPTEFIKRSRL